VGGPVQAVLENAGGAFGIEGSGELVSTLGREATVDCLKLVDHFRDCTKAQLEEVARLSERVQVGGGEVLAREGRVGREFFLILSGSVAVTQQGRRVNTLGPGDFFGELAALNPGPRNATVTALCDLDVLIIGPREFNAMADIPGFRDALLKNMARRLRTVDARLAAALDEREPPRTTPDEPS
jgi:CRP/FNR family cyclic AMP-dependent transcriptional regulator